MIPAVGYGAKSSPDEKGSVASQRLLVVEAIEKLGDRELVDVFGEENQSGYLKSRGPELEAALRVVVRKAEEHGEAELWVYHSSRLARGTGRKGEARALGELLYWLRRRGVTVRSVKDDEFTTNEMLWGFASKQAAKYSEDMGIHIKRGMDERKAAGKPMGAMAFGYTLENERDDNGQLVILRGRVVTKRVEHPVLGPVVVKLFELIADGKDAGAVARWLSNQSVATTTGKGHTHRSVKRIVRNEAYAGAKGYPAIVKTELFEAANAALTTNPALQRSKGGRQQADESYWLRSFSFCGGCGGALFTTRKYHGGERCYACREKVLSSGACKCPPIPAAVLERHVLNHLGSFVGSVEAWIADRVAERDGERKQRERSLDQERAGLCDLDARRTKRMAELEGMNLTAKPAQIALELIERLDTQREAQSERIAAAEALAAEWSPSPNVDEALDFYNGLVDMIDGRVRKASGARELNEALAGLLEGIWCELEPEGERLLVQFALRDQPVIKLWGDHDPGVAVVTERCWLPPAHLGYQPVESPAGPPIPDAKL
jgi:DNA invertase Pin-like site-specific DNA recombinase